MAKAMTYPEVVRILMEGGVIKFTSRGSRPSEYRVHRFVPDSPFRKDAGHISMGQFDALLDAGILDCFRMHSRDDKGFYETTTFFLRQPSEGLQKLWNEFRKEEELLNEI